MKGFKWTGWLNAVNQSPNTKMITLYPFDTSAPDYKLPKDLPILKDIIDDGTTHITIETSESWKCERANCPMDYQHKHGTYPTLNESNS